MKKKMNINTELPNITALRFFLALLVILFHLHKFSHNREFPYFDSWPVLNKGIEAVYMFFSLSGFLIIRNLYMEKLQTGTISIKEFYSRRIRRIFPLYYLVLFFGIIYYFYLLPALGFAEKPADCSVQDVIVLGGSFFANVLEKLKPGGIIEILWSLGIEEQFYIIIAPMLLLLPIKRIQLFLITFTIIYFILLNQRIILFLGKYNMLFYYFAMGGLFSIMRPNSSNIRPPVWLKALVYPMILCYFFTDIFKTHTSSGSYQLISLVLFATFIWCFADRPIAFFQNKQLKYLGKISYGIYVLHAIAIQAMGFVFMKIGHLFNNEIFIIFYNILTILFTLLLAHCSYQYFESRFFKQNNWYNNR